MNQNNLISIQYCYRSWTKIHFLKVLNDTVSDLDSYTDKPLKIAILDI